MAHRLHLAHAMTMNAAPPRTIVVAVVATVLLSHVAAARIVTSVENVSIRGQTFALHLYGSRGGQPVVLSSGDGGWAHLAPHVAETLAAAGLFIVGFDAKAYLSRFTAANHTLTAAEEPRDYAVLVDYAARGSRTNRS
jgi:Bacterial virulence protein (VirJ)